ncbi:hypothetical protein [Pseudomonas sp. SDT291_1_S447]
MLAATDRLSENPAAKKKFDEKALIPLPPAGFASLFFAKRCGGANPSPPMATAGSVGRLAVSLFERNCKELLRACTTCGGWQERVVILKGPADKGGASKK